MPEPIDLSYAVGLPPQDAIAYLRNKGYAFSWDWHELVGAIHSRVFTVAKVMRQDILDDIREMVQKALDEGITFQQFRKELEPRLKAKGWWGTTTETLPDGTERKVQLGSLSRLHTIFRVNTAVAYNAGRWQQQIETADHRPWWQYVAVMDLRTRPAHAALNEQIFRFDDPFWDSFYPPNGWNCRCRVRALTQIEAQQFVREKHGRFGASGNLRFVDRLVSKKTGELAPVAVYRTTHDGKTVEVSPDVGWSYNPGKSQAWQF